MLPSSNPEEVTRSQHSPALIDALRQFDSPTIANAIEARAPDVQLFTPGWVVSHGHGAFLDFGVTVSSCGLTIRPGDLLHGDANGLLTIPPEVAEATVHQAAAIRAEESAYFDFLESDSFTSDKLKQRLASHDQYVQTPHPPEIPSAARRK